MEHAALRALLHEYLAATYVDTRGESCSPRTAALVPFKATFTSALVAELHLLCPIGSLGYHDVWELVMARYAPGDPDDAQEFSVNHRACGLLRPDPETDAVERVRQFHFKRKLALLLDHD